MPKKPGIPTLVLSSLTVVPARAGGPCRRRNRRACLRAGLPVLRLLRSLLWLSSVPIRVPARLGLWRMALAPPSSLLLALTYDVHCWQEAAHQ